VADIYVDPPAHAIVLSVDEKSQIQALDRTQPGPPMKAGRAASRFFRDAFALEMYARAPRQGRREARLHHPGARRRSRAGDDAAAA